MTRTLEQGHTKKCLASAIISYVQNLRDDNNLSDIGFQLMAQDGVVHPAYDYLIDGIQTCRCPD